MKLKKLISAVAAIAMMATMVTSLTAFAALDKTAPTIDIKAADEYEVMTVEGTDYYIMTITVDVKDYAGYSAFANSGMPPKANVKGASGYQIITEMSNADFFSYMALDGTGATSSNAAAVAWNANGYADYLTADSQIATFQIATANPDAATKFSFTNFKYNIFEIAAGAVADEFIANLGEEYAELSIDIPSYNETIAPPPPADVDATVAIEAYEGADSAAGAYTFYYATTVTKGTADIEYVDVLVETGVRAQQAILSADLFSLLDGNFTFYVGNKSDNADTTYTATATVIAGDTVTATASYTTPAE